MAETTTTRAPIVGTTDDEFDALIDGASLPERVVPLCLDGKLRAEYDAVKGRVDRRAAEAAAARAAEAAEALNPGDTRLSSKGPETADERDPEQDRLDELAAQMRARSVKFVVRAMASPDYNRLLEAHPPRKDPATGRIDPRDYRGFDSSKFPPVLVRKSIVVPTMTDERWAKLDALLTDAQFEKLFDAAAELNRRDEDIPF